MSRVVPAAAIVPAAPLLVSAASPDQPAEIRDDVATLREAAHRVLAALPTTDVTVLLAAGARGFHDTAHATLRPLGIRGAEATLPVARDLIPHVTRLTQYPVFVSEELERLARRRGAAPARGTRGRAGPAPGGPAGHRR